MEGFATEERKLVAGTIFGLRAWRIGKTSALKSVTTSYVWTEGDQVGKCDTFWCDTAGYVEHAVASLKGACGFYAYTNGENGSYQPPLRCSCEMCKASFITYDPADYKGIGTIAGVIEAWGRVTVGSRGFRAENARIVALGGGLATRYYDGHDYTTPLESMDVSKTLALYPSVPYFSDVQAMAREFGLGETEEVN